MTHKPFLMGSETEYAASALRGGVWIDPDNAYDFLANAIREVRACVPDYNGCRGVYLENGGRLYLDYGSHPEYCTPECHTPRQVALFDKAGEVMLRLAAERATSQSVGLTLRVIKNNLDPVEPNVNTYGSHESYTCWAMIETVGAQLIPHLVSRVLYCGSGALTANTGGIGFELSQRARHMFEPEGDDTTCERAIFSNRLRKLTDGGGDWTRIHLIGKDSQRSPFGIYLTYATTGLLIELINRGLTVGKGLALADPVQAMQTFSLDPWGKVKALLLDGRELSAVEIQAAYLEESEQALQAGGLPEWAGEAISHWRDTLAAVERDPRRLADRLDPYCKLLLFEHELKRASLEWADLRLALERLTNLQEGFGERVGRAVLNDSDAELTAEERPFFAEARERIGAAQPGVLERLRFAMRLRAVELQYHELGGLYDRLYDAGRMRDVILTPADIEEATRTPPPGGRAAVRGAWVRRCAGEQGRADWHFVWHTGSNECVDLHDPFSGVERVVRLPVVEGTRPGEVDVFSLLQEPAATG